MNRIKISQSLYNHLQACGAKNNILDMYEVDESKKTAPMTDSKQIKLNQKYVQDEIAPWDK